MRILVLSDTHGDFYSMKKALDAQPNAEAIIHCGDGGEQFEYIKQTCAAKTVVGVRGNCDLRSKLQPVEITEIGGKKIFVTHGHLYNAKYTIMDLIYAAKEQGADILLFGHTHMPMTDCYEGLHIMNPGSCAGYFASYGYIDITEKGDIVTNIVKLGR